MSNVAGRRDGMVKALNGAGYVLRSEDWKRKKKSQTDESRRTSRRSTMYIIKSQAGGEFIFPEFTSYVTPLLSLHFLPQLPIQVRHVIQGPPHKPRPRSEITLGKLCTNTHTHHTPQIRPPCHSLGAEACWACPFSATLRPHSTVSRSPCDRVPVAAAPSSANLSLNLMSASPTVLDSSPPPSACPPASSCHSAHSLLPPRLAVPPFPRPWLVCFRLGSLSHSPGSCHPLYGNRTRVPIWKLVLLDDPHRRSPRPPCSSITDRLLTHSPTLSTPTSSPLPADLARDPPPLSSSPPLPSPHLSSPSPSRRSRGLHH